MNQQSPLLNGSISLEYSRLLLQENATSAPLHAADPLTDTDTCVPVVHSHAQPCIPTGDCAPAPRTDSDTCVPVPHTFPREGDGSERVCLPSEGGDCGAANETKYTALAAVQAGWTFPAQPNA